MRLTCAGRKHPERPREAGVRLNGWLGRLRSGHQTMHVDNPQATGIPDCLSMAGRLNKKWIVAGQVMDGVSKGGIPMHVSRYDKSDSPAVVPKNSRRLQRRSGPLYIYEWSGGMPIVRLRDGEYVRNANLLKGTTKQLSGLLEFRG